MNVLVVGEALIDVVVGRDGSTEHVGGSPLNVAVGLSRLGVPTTFGTQLGSDARGALVRKHLSASSVRPLLLAPTHDDTSVATAEIADDGSAVYAFDVTWDATTQLDVADFDAVHVGSLGAVLEPGAAVVVGLAAAARERGIPVSFDPNVRLPVEPDARVWRNAFARLMPYVTYLKMSDEDAQVLSPGTAPADLARALASETTLVAITCGRNGSYLATSSGGCWTDVGATAVADTIGAGDSYMAAMVTWLADRDWRGPGSISQAELHQLGSFASSCAAITCSRPSADPPWARELATDDEP
ncbi:PfkB family carbohydrate kinase [Aeromicrobium endophyticum]|nr:PfkB family carbohydrate kinase [Aeromicrobium endophyticum]